jgi:multiple antibiotic resistance protein
VAHALSQFLVALSAVLFVVDPVGLLPILTAMTRADPPEKIRATCLRACITAGALLAFFALFGRLVFNVFGVTLPAFRVAGGLLLLVTALDMIRARPSETKFTASETEESASKEDIALVPLAMPLLAGPGAVATVMVLTEQSPGVAGTTRVLLAIAVTMVVSYHLLRAANLVQRFLRQSGVALLERVMGLLLAAIAVQFAADGIRELLGR